MTACFETVTLPAGQVLAVRILKIVDPIRTNPELDMPKKPPVVAEGAILPHYNAITGKWNLAYWPRTDERPQDALDSMLLLPDMRGTSI